MGAKSQFLAIFGPFFGYFFLKISTYIFPNFFLFGSVSGKQDRKPRLKPIHQNGLGVRRSAPVRLRLVCGMAPAVPVFGSDGCYLLGPLQESFEPFSLKSRKAEKRAYLTCFHASFFPFCPLCWPPLFLPLSGHLFALFSAWKSTLFCRAKGTAQILERGSFRMDLSTKFCVKKSQL